MDDNHGLSPRQRTHLEHLCDRGVLSREQLRVVVEELGSAPGTTGSRGSRLWEVFGYVGGALVLGGASLLVGMSWEDLARTARVTLLAGVTLVLAAVGLLVAGGPRQLRAHAGRDSSARGRVVSVLFGLAAGTSALAAGSGVDSAASVVGSATGFVVALLGYAAMRRLPGLLVVVGFSAGVVVAVSDEWFDGSQLFLTTGLVVLGAVWAALGASRGLRERRFVVGAGIAIALAGAQVAVTSEQPWWGYGLTLLIALLCFAGYFAEQDPVVLVLGVIGVTIAVPEAVRDWTGGALSGPLTVLLVGVVFLAVGGVGLHLRRTRSRLHARDADR